MLMRRILMSLLIATGCTGSGTVAYRGSASATIVAEQPDLVYVSPGVQVIADYDEPVFYTDNYYWRYNSGVWYRSHTYTGGWAYASPPRALVRIDRPYAYVRYRPQGYVARRPARRTEPTPVYREPSQPVIRDHRTPDYRDRPQPAPQTQPRPYGQDRRDEVHDRNDQRQEQREERREERREEKRDDRRDRRDDRDDRRDKKDHRH